MDYFITFIGFIDEHKRPENFAKQIEVPLFVKANSKDELVNLVNDASMQFIKLQGMSVRVDPRAIENSLKIDTQRMWVPMHMITHIIADVKLVTGETPVLDALGVASMASGAEIVKQ